MVSRYLPLAIAARVWDNFLIDGVEYLFKTALAVIRLLSPHLVGLDIEDVLPILQVRER